MKKLSLLMICALAVMLLTGCKKDNGPKFDAEYGHATITISLKGTLRDFVTVNVIADDKVLDVITPDKPTVTVEFPIDGETVLRTEAVCDKSYELPQIVNMNLEATYDIQVMLGNDTITTNGAGYSYKYNYACSVQTENDIPAVYKLCHNDLDRQFTLTKTEIIAPEK